MFNLFSCSLGTFHSNKKKIGLASWDSVGTQIDIESELRNIAAQCPNGEEVRNGRLLFLFWPMKPFL